MSRRLRDAAGVMLDPFAVAYLNVVTAEADREELVAALSRIARMCGRSRVVEARLLEKIELNGEALYRALCLRGNPELRSAIALLRALGIRLSLQAIPVVHAVVSRTAEGRAAQRSSRGTDLAARATET